MYTILSEVLKSNILVNIKRFIKLGKIIVIDVIKSLNNEIEAILNYIDSKGYIIKSLEEGLKE